MTTSAPSPRRRALFLAVPYAAVVLLLAAVEITVRWRLPHVDPLEWLVVAPEQRAQLDDRREVRIFEGDPLLFWKLLPDLDRVIWDLTLVSTNGQALRYPRDVGPKRPGAFRILCLGDSVTFGYRVPRVLPRRPDEYHASWQPYPALVEARLRAANPGRIIEVIPLAVPGYSSHQGRAWIGRDIDTFRPDVVTACFGWNDISRRALSDRQAMSTSRGQVLARRVLASSQALVHLGMRFRRHSPAPAEACTMRVPREEYVENLLAIAGTVRSRRATPVILGPVYRDRTAHPPEGDDMAAHRRALRGAAARDAVTYLEIPELTEDSHPANNGLFEAHIHPNHQGHKLMADRLLALLVQRRLLGDLKAPQP